MTRTYKCPEHGAIHADTLLWCREDTGVLVSWKDPPTTLIYPTCPRCGQKVGRTIRNRS